MSIYSFGEMESYLSHFSPNFSDDIQKYANEHMFTHYIFVERKGKRQFGYCTYCRNDFDTAEVKIVESGAYTRKLSLRHNDTVSCPKCENSCTVRASGMGRSKMIDEAYFVYYQKSVANPNVLVARGIYAVRDYRGHYRDVHTRYKDRARYIFDMGNSAMLKRYTYYSWDRKSMNAGGYEKCKEIYSEFGHYSLKPDVFTGCCRESIAEAVKGTPFQYSTWDQYEDGDMVKFFDLYSKYPCIEHLTKLGYGNLVEAKLSGSYTYGAVNWRAGTIFKALRLNRKEMRDIRELGITLDSLFLRLYQISKRDGSKMSLYDICEVKRAFANAYIRDLYSVLKYSSLRKAFTYIGKQYKAKAPNGRGRFESIQSTLINWRDYMADCIRLEMDLSSEKVLYPRDLYTAHQNTITQVKVKENEEFDKKIRKRAQDLNRKYYFEHGGLIIRAAETSKELIEEGKALSHCVGTYAQSYAEGRTGILLIRKAAEPDKPYYTMEIRSNGTIAQTRGKNNCLPSPKVKEFQSAFENERLVPKKQQSRVEITVPA